MRTFIFIVHYHALFGNTVIVETILINLIPPVTCTHPDGYKSFFAKALTDISKLKVLVGGNPAVSVFHPS